MLSHVRRLVDTLATMERMWEENHHAEDIMEQLSPRLEVPLTNAVRVWPEMLAKDITLGGFDLGVLLTVMRKKVETELHDLECQTVTTTLKGESDE